jgi:biopolymer transport protein ExbB
MKKGALGASIPPTREGAHGVENMNVLDMIRQGWLATYPLIVLSVVSLTVIGERLWAFRGMIGKTAALTRTIYADVSRGDVGTALGRAEAQRRTPAGRIFYDVLRQCAVLPLDQLDQVSGERRFEEMERLKGSLWILGTVAASAPFIGLFGTVVGIVKAFHSMATLGSGGFAVVAGGISEALIATALGLVVAIVALIFYNYFQVRLDRMDAALTIGGARLIEALRLERGTAEPPLERVADGRR